MPTEHRKITAEDQDRVLRKALEKARRQVRITPGQRRHILERFAGRCPYCGAWKNCQ